MSSGEKHASFKELIHEVAAKFEDKWDIDKNSSPPHHQKNKVLKEIMHDVAEKLGDKLDSFHDRKKHAEEGEVGSAKDGKENDQKNLHNSSSTSDDDYSKKHETGSVESLSEDPSDSSHPTSGSLTGDKADVKALVPTSQSGHEE